MSPAEIINIRQTYAQAKDSYIQLLWFKAAKNTGQQMGCFMEKSRRQKDQEMADKAQRRCGGEKGEEKGAYAYYEAFKRFFYHVLYIFLWNLSDTLDIHLFDIGGCMGILFVCTGNTCRSPMAEALARSTFADSEFISRGVSAFGGGGASSMALRVMKEIYGLDLKDHVSRLITEEDAKWANLILTMTEAHRRQVAELFPFAADKLYTVWGFANDNARKNRDISDPFMGDFAVYSACAAEIKECLDLIDFSRV